MKLKSLIKPLIVSMLVAASAVAGPISLMWDENSPSEGVTGYYVYQAAGTNAFQPVALVVNLQTTNAVQMTRTNNILVTGYTGNPSYTPTNLAPNIYKWKVTATNAFAESGFSTTVTAWVGGPAAPGGLRVIVWNQP